MQREDYLIKTKADFDDLPPLVAAGQEREKIIAQVVERWVEQTTNLLQYRFVAKFNMGVLERHPATLSHVDLRDDNAGAEPIDLGQHLLRPLAKRLAITESLSDNASKNQLIHSRAVVAMLGCRVHKVDASGLQLPISLVATGCLFEDDVSFEAIDLRGNAYLSGSIFCGEVRIDDSTFDSDVIFDAASFDASVYFRGTAIRRSAYFRRAKFIGDFFFDEARVKDRVFFHSSTFGGDAFFDETTIGGNAYFTASMFAGSASFADMSFSAHAFYNRIVFRDSVSFLNASFEGDALFKFSSFSDFVTLHNSKFNGNTSFEDVDLRRAKLDLGMRCLRHDPQGRSARLSWSDWLNWERVRKTGELTALTRVSYFALIGVPLLAGLWASARAWIARQNTAFERVEGRLGELVEKSPAEPAVLRETLEAARSMVDVTLPEALPVGWLLAFLAAFAVVLAQLIYQVRAPELIREKSVDDLVDEANEINRQDDGISDERLRQAVDYLRTAAAKMPHRHNAWFVERGSRTVWIPNNVEEHFRDAEEDEPRPEGAAEDWVPTEKVKASGQEVDAADRKRIAIEEGQKARYAVAAFEGRASAWLSGGLYGVAGFLLLMIVLRQLGHVAAVSGVEGLAWAMLPFVGEWFVGFVLVVMGLMLVGTVAGAWLAKEEGWAAKGFEKAVDGVAAWSTRRATKRRAEKVAARAAG